MKTIIKCILLFTAITFTSNYAKAQSSTVHILDLNPGTDIDSAMSSTGNVRLTVNFKVDNEAQADSVFFKFGTTPGGAETTTETGEFRKVGSIYFVKVQGPSYQIINTEASCKVKISAAEFHSSTYLSLVVKDKSGQFTNVLHIRIN